MFINIPWFSTFTLCTEILVTAGLFYVFYFAYAKNIFSYKTAGVVLAYEILFNITYMAKRFFTHVDNAIIPHSSFYIALAIFHGTFSLLMFILLVIFMFFAWKNYGRGINYFKEHRRMTIVFLVSWIIAVLSGVLFYYVAYFSS
jgi:heme A synthase